MLDPRSQAKLDEILAKDVSALNEQDAIFLRARRSYLTPAQEELYADILEAEPAEVVVEENPDMGQHPGEVEDAERAAALEPKPAIYAELLKQAKALGYKGKRVSRGKLEAFIADHS